MGEPVKLSRERWEMLLGTRSLGHEFSNRPSDNMVTLLRPLEIDGVIFLPAQYVPGGEPRQFKPDIVLARGGEH